MIGKMLIKVAVCMFSALALVSPAEARPFLDGDFCLDAKRYPVRDLLKLPEVVEAIANGEDELLLEYSAEKFWTPVTLKFSFKNQGVVSLQKKDGGCVLFYDHWQYTKHHYKKNEL